MQLLGIILVKNDAPVLREILTRYSECCDGIIAVNDGSTDESAEIISTFPKVIHCITNPPYQKWYPFRDMERVMKKVHEIKPDWVMYIDSDDLLDKRFVHRKHELLNAEGVGRYWFKEITLWYSKTHYRIDNPDRYSRDVNFTPYLIRYNPTIKVVTVGQHESFKMRCIYALRHSLVFSYLAKKIFSYRFYMKLEESTFKNILTVLLYPKDSHDITHVRIGGEKGRAEISGLVKVHYHYAHIYYAARKHINFALQIGLRQWRTAEEISELSNRFAKGLNDDGLQLKEVDPSWGVL